MLTANIVGAAITKQLEIIVVSENFTIMCNLEFLIGKHYFFIKMSLTQTVVDAPFFCFVPGFHSLERTSLAICLCGFVKASRMSRN